MNGDALSGFGWYSRDRGTGAWSMEIPRQPRPYYEARHGSLSKNGLAVELGKFALWIEFASVPAAFLRWQRIAKSVMLAKIHERRDSDLAIRWSRRKSGG